MVAAASYQKKKSAKTPLVQNTPAHTPEARVSQTSAGSVSQPYVEVKEKYSDRDYATAQINDALLKENEGLREDVAYLNELLKLQRQVTGGAKFTRNSVEASARVASNSPTPPRLSLLAER